MREEFRKEDIQENLNLFIVKNNIIYNFFIL
jgi:hypothetical protein